MRDSNHPTVQASLLGLVCVLLFASGIHANEWPSFRGLRAAGVADGTNPPVEWDVGAGETIAWKTPIAGMAHSSPIIIGDRIYLTTAISSRGETAFQFPLEGEIDRRTDLSEHQFRVLAFHLKTGSKIWDVLALEAVPRVARHPHSSYAAPTPATNDTSQSWELRLRAATYLLKLEQEVGWQTFTRALEAPDLKTLQIALRTLPQYYDVDGPLPAELVERLERLTSHPSPEVRLAAMTHLLRRGGEPQARYVRDIAGLAGDQVLTYDTESVLQGVIENAEGELRSSALAEFERRLRAGKPSSQFAVSFYLTHAEASGLPYVRSKVGASEYQAGEALVALGRLEAPGAREVLLEALSDRRQSWYAVRGLGLLAKGTEDRELIDQIARAGRNQGHLRHYYTAAIAAIGGPDAAPAIESILATDMLPAARREALDEISGRSLESRLRELHELGITPDRIVPERRDLEYALPLTQTMQALERAGVAIGFDTETSTFPNRHDVLIEQFGDKSLGKFHPQATREVWFGEGAKPGLQDDLAPPPTGEGYIVEFVHDRRLYRFPCENYGDWYDVEAVSGAINRALADSGVAERFVALYTGGQDSVFVFTRPELARQADERSLLLLAASNSEGRERGQAFEKAVLERLKGSR